MSKIKNEYDIENAFQKVLALVNDGYTISKAVASVGLDRAIFYRSISTQGKLALKQAKMQYSFASTIIKDYREAVSLHNFYASEDTN